LAQIGITTLEMTNRSIATEYLLRFNAEFAVPARESGSAFIAWVGGPLDEILCEHHERTVGVDNGVRFEKRHLQIPADRHRGHYVKAKVRVHVYPDGRLAIFHGPRKLADYTAQGKLITEPLKQAA
jgi:hypothetical protein